MAACLGLLLVFDLADHPVWFLSLVAGAFVALLWASRYLAAGPSPPTGLLLGTAVLMRLLLLPLPPTLSDDVFRYVWDGRVTRAGFNPYALAPEVDELAHLRDDLWQQVAHREVETVYPPLAIGLFTIAASFPKPVLTLKLLLSIVDVLSCALLLRLAQRLAVSPARIVWYAWNPLVLVEIAGMGHVDALGIPAVLAVVLLLVDPHRQRGGEREEGKGFEGRFTIPARAAAAAVAGVLVKIVPLVALPMWAKQSGRPGHFLLLSSALLVAVAIPVMVTTGGIPPGLITYGVSWEFNGPLFEPLWRLLDQTEISPGLKGGLDSLKAWTGHHAFWNELYPYVYPQFLAKLALGAGLLAVVVWSWRRVDPVSGTAILFGSAILFSATVYPWYLVWVLPWAALRSSPTWLLLSATIQLSYLPQLLDVELVPWVFLSIWLPVLAVQALRRRWSIA